MAKKKIGYAKGRTDILKKITTEAKNLRAKKPALSWTDAIKQAGALYRKAAPAKKAVKVVSKPKIAPKKSAAKKVAKKKVSGVKVVKMTKKPVAVRGKHNFNISTVGLESQRSSILARIKESDYQLNNCKDFAGIPSLTAAEKVKARKAVKIYADQIKTFKLHLREINAMIAKQF
jgi:hypothetical protein